MTESDGMKICSKCGLLKPPTEFHKQGGPSKGLRANCKECDKKRQNIWNANNRKLSREEANTDFTGITRKEMRENKERERAENFALGVKVCSICGITKPLTEFGIRIESSDGLRTDCKKCMKSRRRAWYLENKEELIAKSVAYEKAKDAITREIREREHAEYLSRGLKTCTKCGKEKPFDEFSKNGHDDGLRAYCKMCGSMLSKMWYTENLERALETRHAYYADKDNAEIFRAGAARRRQRIEINMTDVDRELSVTYRKTIKNDPCFYCGEISDIMHDDHIVALVHGGTDHWWNLVRACARCNLRKGTMTAEVFMEVLKNG
jgi:hypothetical protein